jgi:hypothetical protein
MNAEGAITPRRIVKFGAADGGVLQATAVSEALLGVAVGLGSLTTAYATGERVDVLLGGTAQVEYGGTVARGDWLTTDASGRAVTANPGAGVNNNVIGRAMLSGVVGDWGEVFLAPGRIQG